MNTITLAELYNQQYPITRISNGNAFFLQENDTGFGFNLEDDKGNIVAKDLPKDKILNVGVQGVILLDGHSYQINTGRKNQPAPVLTRNPVIAYLSKPITDSDLTVADRIHIFKTILKGLKHVKVSVISDACLELGVDFDAITEKVDYDFYRFASLVKDLLLEPNNLWVPYDMQHEIILKFYGDFNYSEDVEDPHEEQVSFIKSNEKLFSALYEANEGTIPEMPKKSIEQEQVKFVTKTITWEGLGHVCDMLLDHNEVHFTLAELKTPSNNDSVFEVLPDNRVIMQGQIYTPVAYITPEVYSL